MRKKQAVSGGKTITVHIPIAWKRRGGRKVIIARRRRNHGRTRR